jgi:hypothetical protein
MFKQGSMRFRKSPSAHLHIPSLSDHQIVKSMQAWAIEKVRTGKIDGVSFQLSKKQVSA